MQVKRKHLMLKISTLALVAVAIAVCGAVVLKRNHTDAAASVKLGTGAAVPSQFTFSGVTGWWQGATNKTSMAVFHNSDSCFTSVVHKTGSFDAAAELQKQKDTMTSEGYPVNVGSAQTLTLQTTAGPKQYELQQLNVTTPVGAHAVLAGQEFGYVQLANGYIKVEGYCDTSAELSSTIPVLQSIKFDESK